MEEKYLGEELSFFPKPYPDEDFRSLIYRYHIRSGNTSFGQSKLELFDLTSFKNRQIPTNINHLVNKLESLSNEIVNDFLQEHTFLPLIYPFLSKERIHSIMSDIKEGKRNKTFNVGNLLRNKGQKIISDKIRYCTLCLESDYIQFGEAYAHLIHQLEFLDFCPTHKNKLIIECPVCQINLCNNDKSKLITSPNCFNGHDLTHTNINSSADFKADFVANVVYILNKKMSVSKENITEKFHFLLRDNGYITNDGKVRTSKLVNDIIKKYGEESIEKIGLSINYLSSRDVLFGFFHQNSTQCYQLYILLMMFFKDNTKEFFEMDIVDESFNIRESGPWPCINVFCKYYGENNIYLFKRTFSRKNYNSIILECDCCGVRYTRIWDKNNKGKQHDREMMIRFGWLLEQSIFEEYSNETSFVAIARRANVSVERVRSVIKKRTQEEIYRSNREISASVELDEKKLISCSINEDNKFKNNISVNTQNKICWETVDMDLANKIKTIAQNTYNNPPSKRIIKLTLVNKLSGIDRSRLRRNMDFTRNNLPVTNATIEKYIEPIEEYQIRKLDDKIHRLKNKGCKNITLRSLISDSGLYKNCSKEVIEFINNRLSTLN